MTGEGRAETLEPRTAGGHGFETLAASLWTQDNMRLLSTQSTGIPLHGFEITGLADQSAGNVASGADGFSLFDSAIASKPERAVEHTEDAKAPQVWYHQPVVEAQKIQQREQDHFLHGKVSAFSMDAAPHGVPKCNIFLYAVMDAAGVPLPRGPHGRTLTAGKLDRALEKDPRFDKVFARHHEESKWKADKQRYLTSFHAQDGDIAIWNNAHLQHTGVLEETLDGHGNTYYAGREKDTGLGHTNMQQWWITSPTPGYGAPDAVYRYKHFYR